VLLHHPSAIPLTHHPASTINWKRILLGGATLPLPGGWPMVAALHGPCTALAIVASAIQRPQIVQCPFSQGHQGRASCPVGAGWCSSSAGKVPFVSRRTCMKGLPDTTDKCPKCPPNPCLPNTKPSQRPFPAPTRPASASTVPGRGSGRIVPGTALQGILRVGRGRGDPITGRKTSPTLPARQAQWAFLPFTGPAKGIGQFWLATGLQPPNSAGMSSGQARA
jgi:hypothetical protein